MGSFNCDILPDMREGEAGVEFWDALCGVVKAL